jgi:hypothetical protein
MHALALVSLLALAQPAAELARVERGGLVYVALPTGGVQILDLSDPANPKEVGKFAEGRRIHRILVDGDALILLELRQEASSWSLADPRAPTAALMLPAGPASAPTAPAQQPQQPPAVGRPRATFELLAGFNLRPFLGIGTSAGGTRSKPFGLILDAYGTWYSQKIPLAVSVAIAPAGIGLGGVDRHYPLAAAATAAYALDFFEIGLGLGGLVGNAGPCNSTPLGATECEVNTGLTINQVLRLGALDGLSLTWRSSIFSRPDEFVFGVGRAEANIPLGRKLSLRGAGGAGENGWAFGEFGVRTYLNGEGGAGTVLLTASLGYAAIFDGPSHELIGGPSVAFGAEWRI